MSDRMKPISASELLTHIFDEYQNEKSIFGIKKMYKANKDKVFEIFGEKIETPFGPAAGPHTQLAQNIIASYLCGSRFFELKTVQKLDGEDLPVAKPCIIAADEAYNCEWSTELYIPQAYDEYVKAWFILKLLAKELDLGSDDGFIFNMSVGYDLEGIKTKKIDNYIEGMKDASSAPVFAECKEAALKAFEKGYFKKVTRDDIESVPVNVSGSITISTLHGCPPEEIERIAMYLITEKKLHTFVKCNPTLLGYEFARKTLDGLGFDYIAFDDHHFLEDLQYSDAVPMLKRLQKSADSLDLSFGVKLTNTFPVDVKENQLPSEEMYMSGRSLLPLTLALGKKLSTTFDGKLRISYSGGADYSNIESIVDCGIWPVTMATTMLKPGGYQRLVEIGKIFDKVTFKPFTGVNVKKVTKLADLACSPLTGSRKPVKIEGSRKLTKKLPLFDCFTASCSETCPIHQDIPAYIQLCGEGKYAEALRVITDKNPLPFITGTICAHTCMNACTRNFYDSSVLIRQEKLKAAENGYGEILKELKNGSSLAQKSVSSKSDKKVAIIGGGPAGLSAAFLLAREGVCVTLFEKEKTCGGIVRHVIPSFRISDEAIEKDVELAKAAGAEIVTGKEITDVKELLSNGYTDILLAIGAWEPASLRVDEAQCIDALEFLHDCKTKSSETLLRQYGDEIVVIGGGNTAMDTARAAMHIPGVKTVRLVYRRTKRYMPADAEELELAMEDGVTFMELRSPVKVSGDYLECDIMKLGDADASGRRRPIATGEKENLPCSSIIAATGESISVSLYESLGMKMDTKKRPILSKTMESSVSNIYVIGDAAQGPATVVEAIADATSCATALCEVHNKNYESKNTAADTKRVMDKKGITSCADQKACEATRCLECKTICENCVDVCPNRANVAVEVTNANGSKAIQIVHVDAMCNECGNCALFCPWSGEPYKDKFTLFSSVEDMKESTNNGWAPLNGIGGNTFRVRLAEAGEMDIDLEKLPKTLDADVASLIKAVRNEYKYLYY